MKFTRYFEAMRQRPDRSLIREEWIQRVIEHPVRQAVQQDGRIRRLSDSSRRTLVYFAETRPPLA